MQTNIESQVSGFFVFTSIGSIMTTLIDASIIVGALATLLYLIYGGFGWITSGGDPKKLDESQHKITNAIIGLIIIVSAYAIFLVIRSFLGLEEALPTS